MCGCCGCGSSGCVSVSVSLLPTPLFSSVGLMVWAWRGTAAESAFSLFPAVCQPLPGEQKPRGMRARCRRRRLPRACGTGHLPGGRRSRPRQPPVLCARTASRPCCGCTHPPLSALSVPTTFIVSDLSSWCVAVHLWGGLQGCRAARRPPSRRRPKMSTFRWPTCASPPHKRGSRQPLPPRSCSR